MKSLLRLVLPALAILLPFGLLAGLFACWYGGSDLNMIQATRELTYEIQRGQKLQRQIALVRQRMESEAQVARAVIAGRMTLDEATDAFRKIQEEMKESMGGADDALTRRTDTELRRAVLAWVRSELGKDPSRVAMLNAGLKTQLQ